MHVAEDRPSIEELDRLGEEIADISAHIDAATHRLLACIRRFDAGGGWAQQGALTCAHWLSWRIGVGIVAAREYVRVARALGDLPLVDEALRRGELSYCKARALTRAATPENERTLVDWARSCTGAQLDRVCAKYRRVLRTEGILPVDEPELRFVRVRDTAWGMVQITAQLLPEEAAIVMKALEVARDRVRQDGNDSAEAPVAGASAADRHASAEAPAASVPDDARRQADAARTDALLWMAEAVLAGGLGDGPHSAPVEVVVHVDADALTHRGREPEATLDDGRTLEPETTSRLLCDTAIVKVVEDRDGTPLDVGRRTRTIPSALKRALRLRDRGCRFPGCTHRRTDGHHVVPWSAGGATALGNLVSLCRRHHRFVHEMGWRVEGDCASPDLIFRSPRGRAFAAVATRARVHDDAIERIRRDLADDGVDIDVEASRPRSDYTPCDMGLAIEALVYRHPSVVAMCEHGRHLGPAVTPAYGTNSSTPMSQPTPFELRKTIRR